MLDDEIDPLIDEVARAMTAAPPDAQLAHRVSVRLAGERDTSRAVWARPWVLVPIASACALLLAVFVAREVRMPVKPIVIPGMATVEPPAPYVERAFPARGGGDPERVALQKPRSAPLPLPESPPAIALLEVDRLEVQSLVEMSAIEMSPIAIDRIEIAAMP